MSGSPAAPSRVLLVEDDPTLRELLALVLRDEGYAARVAASPVEACALLATQPCHLVVTDLFAHAADDPLGSIRALRERAAGRPVGVMTGRAITADAVAQAGFAFLVHKPFNLDHLLVHIAASLAPPLSAPQKRQARVVRRYFAALAARDWDALLALCTDTITYVLPGPAPFAATVRGQAAFRAYTEETYRHFAPIRFTAIQVYATPQGLAARYRSAWPSPPGATLRHEGIVLFAFAGDRIARIGVYVHADRLRAQLHAPLPPPQGAP
ncbi:MAG: nuclear transport factor 2 family protein [Chloroflexota bacterium]|nr:nuclear transport factor 2 family protein [Chloroflexota bacterium]